MTTVGTIYFEDRTWFVGTGITFLNKEQVSLASVVIPIDQIENMAEEEIGFLVKEAAQFSEILLICEDTSYIACHGHLKRDIKDMEDVDSFEQVGRASLKRLTTFLDEGVLPENHWLVKSAKNSVGEIDAQLEELESIKLSIARRLARQKKRGVFDNQRDQKFLAIGRRDGFHCQSCKATTDLTVDHIVPLAGGGTNDLDNLQILCRTCNSRKGSKFEEVEA